MQHRSFVPPSLLLAALSLCGACERSYPSLPGPEPEGCERPEPFDPAAMSADLAYLASPALDGRAPGSAGDEAARAFVAERFACLGLDPVGADYGQPFTDEEGNETGNVLAMIPGSGADDAAESIVITAHIDHFGDGYLGANDNASGVTALLAIAQDLANRAVRPDRTLVFAVVGAEESGFEGSDYLMRHPPSGLDRAQIVYNVNMDMVGSYTASETLFAFGTFAGTRGRAVLSSQLDERPDLDVSMGEGTEESDNFSFCDRDIPYVFFWTDDPECYHRRCDTSSRIDFEAMSEIVPLMGEVALELANSAEDLADAGCGE